MSTISEPWVVVKVGGSLFDLPDLRARLNGWLTRFDAARVLLIAGGGGAADMIRTLDRLHQLGEEASHWLAIQAMSLNAHFLQAIVPTAQLMAEIPATEATSSSWHILDAYPFFRADEQRSDHLPHLWHVTSDSLAVRAAVLLSARELILLKSTSWQGPDWSEAMRLQHIDSYFMEALRQAPARLRTHIVDLRSWSMETEKGSLLRR